MIGKTPPDGSGVGGGPGGSPVTGGTCGGSASLSPVGGNTGGPATPAVREPVITSTSPAAGLLCRSIVPELVNVCTPIKWPCNGPPSAMLLLGLPSGRYCPVLSSVVAPITLTSASVPMLVKVLP